MLRLELANPPFQVGDLALDRRELLLSDLALPIESVAFLRGAPFRRFALATRPIFDLGGLLLGRPPAVLRDILVVATRLQRDSPRAGRADGGRHAIDEIAIV